MFEITTATVAEIAPHLNGYGANYPFIRETLRARSVDAPPSERPFVQLDDSELPGDVADRILGYADIPRANRPVGIDYTGEPVVVGGDASMQILLYSLAGLESHIRASVPDIAKAYDASGGMNAFVELRGDSLTAEEYLVGGTLDCIRYCRQMRHVLVIRW